MVGLLVAERPKKWSLSQGRITAALDCDHDKGCAYSSVLAGRPFNRPDLPQGITQRLKPSGVAEIEIVEKWMRP